MKKVLIGVGIGCGTLVLLGVVATVAFGLWARRQVEASGISTAALEESIRRAQAMQQRAQALEQKYPFAAPAGGQPLLVEEGRLRPYLAVRAAMLPRFQEFQEKARALKAKGEPASVAESLETSGRLFDLFTGLQDQLMTELDRQKMSSSELTAITSALYPSGEEKLHEHNAALAEKHQAELERTANPKLDLMLVAGLDGDLDGAFEEIDQPAGEPEPADPP